MDDLGGTAGAVVGDGALEPAAVLEGRAAGPAADGVGCKWMAVRLPPALPTTMAHSTAIVMPRPMTSTRS
jgi:hypothetical protein